MAFFLSIDASTHGCSAAIFKDNILVAVKQSEAERSAAEYLTTLIKDVVEMANMQLGDLDAVAVAKGPGSYTGLRIAVSTAKGLSFALNKPLISFGTLDSLIYQLDSNVLNDFDLLCPMIDARRMEVFCAFFNAKSKEILSEVKAEIVNEASFLDILSENKVLFIGEGSQKCKELFTTSNANVLDQIIYPSAQFTGELIFKKWTQGLFEDLVTFEPYYLKEYIFKTKKTS